MSNSEKRKTFFALDALRGVAALGVVVFHVSGLLQWELAPSGYLAVDFFFVMSGFVVAHSYEAKLLSRQLSFPGFVMRRLIRFYPLLVLGVILGLVREGGFFALGTPDQYGVFEVCFSLVLSLLFLPTPPLGFAGLFPLNGPAWSLFFELGINVIYGATLRALSNRALVLIITAAAATLGLASYMLGDVDGGHDWSTFWVGVARVGFSFPLGVFIYRHRMYLPSCLSALGFLVAPGLLMITFVIDPTIQLRPLYDLTFIGLVSPLIVVLAIRNEPAVRLLGVASYFGAISYCIYAIHYPIIGIASGASNVTSIPSPLLGGFVVLVLMIACPIIDRYYDKPTRRWLSGVWAKGGAEIPLGP